MKIDDFTWTVCITCGVQFVLPNALYDHQVKKGGYHHCPNGHKQGWSIEESELARTRRERDNARQQVARAEDEAREALAKVSRIDAEMKRLKKRASAGTCPCCQRNFSNMSRHMKSEHPDFIAENVVKLKAKK